MRSVTPSQYLLARYPYSPVRICHRLFNCSSKLLVKQLPPRRIILDSEIEENFLKGSGPGGQKINKTSSAVQLKHLPTGIVIKCQESRSRSFNRKQARRLLSDRIEELELGEQSRTVVKAKERSKKKASADKKKRRKYRELAEKKGSEQDEEGAEQSGHVDGVESDNKQDMSGLIMDVDDEPRHRQKKDNSG